METMIEKKNCNRWDGICGNSAVWGTKAKMGIFESHEQPQKCGSPSAIIILLWHTHDHENKCPLLAVCTTNNALSQFSTWGLGHFWGFSGFQKRPPSERFHLRTSRCKAVAVMSDCRVLCQGLRPQIQECWQWLQLGAWHLHCDGQLAGWRYFLGTVLWQRCVYGTQQLWLLPVRNQLRCQWCKFSKTLRPC